MQWVSYKDAADQCSLSRIWGGIHPYIDDIPGRLIGKIIGNDSFEFGAEYFEENLSNPEIEKIALRLIKNPIEKNDYITVLNTTGLESFELYSITGQMVQTSADYQSGKTKIFSDNLSSGIYLLKIDEITLKVVVK